MKNNSDSLEIIDSNFRDNKVIYQKGGCIINNASLTLRNCSFKNNFSNAGSCVFNSEDSSLKIFDCEFNNNTSRKDFEAGGVRFSLEVPSSGGTIVNEGSLEMTSSKFDGNSGYAIVNKGILKEDNCKFKNNQPANINESGK